MNSLSPCFITQPVFLPRSAAEPDANDDMRFGTLRDLRDQLRQLQTRLGTPAELTGDLEQARQLAHEINNRMTIEYLHSAITRANTGPFDLPPPGGPQRLVA